MAFKHVVLAVLMLSVGTAYGSLESSDEESSCFKNMNCEARETSAPQNFHPHCSAQWGAFPRINTETNNLIATQLTSSFQYLLIASHFKEWKAHRPGFAKYFTKLSDDNWEEAISLLTHMVERGGKLDRDFNVNMTVDSTTEYQLWEMDALSMALDKEKATADQTLRLAHNANHKQGEKHDIEFTDFLAERLHHNSVMRIKHLANYVNLLSDFVDDKLVDTSYALFKFDSYLE